jgi:hypothetical protein
LDAAARQVRPSLTLYKRTGNEIRAPRVPPERASNQKPKVYPRSTGIIGARAPVAQWIERRPPEPDCLSVVATRVGPRAKRGGFYALRSRDLSDSG